MQPSDTFVGSIDQGTTSTRFLIFNREGEPVASHQVEFTQIYPNPGWHEHNPLEIVTSVETCIEEAVQKFEAQGHTRSSIKSIGITNQRETTIVWDHETGVPLYNAIVWTDTRSQAIVAELKQKPGAAQLQTLCGLPLSTYSSATKLLWMLAHVPRVKDAFDRGTLAFGTVDAWLVYRLNGGVAANVFVSDSTNASRTMFVNLETLRYDETLLDFFGIRGKVHLPRIVPSSDSTAYGVVSSGALAQVPIMGCLGDQSAALVGQKGFSPGMAKNTYGTGCFLLYNVGDKPVFSTHGLLATVAYHFSGKPVYALEGSIAVAGSGIKFLQNNLNFFQESKEVNDLAYSVDDNGGCVFVTAFSGLFAPYWIDDAKGTIFGITQYTQKGHIARATLEATCFQTKAILDAMEKDSGHALSELAVDGGMSNSDLAMQTQADLISIPVYRPKMRETTALGAAIAAGLAVGLWRNFAELRDINRSGGAVFEPQVLREESAAKFGQWERAVQMSRGWVRSKTTELEEVAGPTNETYTPEKPHDIPPPKAVQLSDNNLVSEVVKSSTYTTEVKGRARVSVKEIEFLPLPVQTALGSVLGDLDDADEEDLFLELRKVEILQRLRKIRKQSDSY
ncbi:Glycerol kinase [Penicillium cf. griseofulvum]|uniref:glycerol kinase n=1 Tax=Penicillium cf. griseofulvum TaxID=2972120 RepID=A0A9W9M735_9EURO|nr:Glycerol kinase [Penicillium cf. griseofulvum]KAJ5435344.1 Glycerol kinase [Penicillium cf. griseofulvum]KAJ5453175.1 Glycerol kinase [Penicillium cf. griseofulvum]